MTNILDALGQYLPTVVSGLTLGQNLYLGRLPTEAPNQVVLIQPYASRPPSLTMGGQAIAIDNLKIQIKVRGNPEDYPGSYALANSIRLALSSFVNTQNIDGITILRISTLGTINPMPYDEGNRPSFTMNFEINVNNPT